MIITDHDREVLERSLDVLLLRIWPTVTQSEMALAHRAMSIVRERPAGVVRIRRDAGVKRGRRPSAVQPELSGMEVKA